MKGETLSVSADNRAANAVSNSKLEEVTMLYASEFDQSKYLRAADIGDVGSEKRLKIKAVTKELDVGEEKQSKPCLWFTTTEKGLLLNKTNLRVLRDAFGDPMGPYVGRVVVVFVVMADFRGKMVPALRVRIPPPKAPPPKQTPKPVDEELDGFDDPEQLDDDVSDIR
jgi:hypothetical protein